MQDHSKPGKYDVQQETYNEPNKPLMPPEQATHYVPPLSPLASKVITKQWALANEFAFLQDIHTKTNCPEYNGYNTRHCCQVGMLPQPHTEVALLPISDRPSAHPDTIKTTIERDLSLASAAGEDVLIFKADQQLHKGTVDILLHEPTHHARRLY